MPFRRRKIKRVTMGKDPIKHSATKVSTIGNGSLVGAQTLISTNAGDRSLDGGLKVIQAQANTGNIVMVSSIVKYITVHFQSAITDAGVAINSQGWLEYAVVWRDEVLITPPTTNLGTLTLGDICTQMFRGDCITTGNFPVSVNLPNSHSIQIKLPKKAVKWRLGDQLILFTIFRSATVTDVDTTSTRLLASSNFKVYN